MMRRFAVACGLATILAGVTACGAARPSMFYQLNIPDTSAPSSSPRFDTDLLVGRMITSNLYRNDRIVYRTGATQLGTYEYHRWAEPPADTMETLLVRALRSSGNYRSVQSQRSNARGDYILRGHLYELDEVSSANLAGRLDFEVELYSQKSGTVVWSKHYNNDQPVDGRKVPAVVDALNRNLQRAINEVVAGLAEYFSKNPPQN